MLQSAKIFVFIHAQHIKWLPPLIQASNAKFKDKKIIIFEIYIKNDFQTLMPGKIK